MSVFLYHAFRIKTADTDHDFLKNMGFSTFETENLLHGGHKDSCPPIFYDRSYFEEKYNTSCVKITFDGRFQGGRPGRYHVFRSCIYTALSENGALAEAAHYFRKYRGDDISENAKYGVAIFQTEKEIVDIKENYKLSDILCENHIVSQKVEDQSRIEDWNLLMVPSVRLYKSKNVVVYEFEEIKYLSVDSIYEFEIDIKYPKCKIRNSKNKKCYA